MINACSHCGTKGGGMSNKNNNIEKNTDNIKVIDKAIDILEILSESDDSICCSVSNIAKELKMSRSTVYRIMRTLMYHNFISKDDNSGKYILGWELYRLGCRVKMDTDVYLRIRKDIEGLNNILNETVSLYFLKDAKVLVVDSYKRGEGLKIDVPIGVLEPIHATASGKCLLLDYSYEDIVKLLGTDELSRYTSESITSIDELYANISETKEYKYTTSFEEYIYGMAAPIRDHTGNIIAAVTISAPIQRMNKSNIQNFYKPLIDTANRASTKLGYNGKK